VRVLHSSDEYESFPLLCRILSRLAARFPGITFRHMVKLGEPHFDEDAFSGQRLAARVDIYRQRLRTDRIADVQWMWRHGIPDDARRVERFSASAGEIARAAAALKADSVIGRFLCFPYTPAFAQVALEMDAVDGLVVYRNQQEREYDGVIDRASGLGKPCVIIRPFLGGKLVRDEGSDAASLLRFALNKPAIESAVVSCSRLDRLKDLIGGLE
jgi:hypothetical protein